MRVRLLLAGLAAAALAVPQAASASHHVDCAGAIAAACTVINHTVFCHTTPPC